MSPARLIRCRRAAGVAAAFLMLAAGPAPARGQTPDAAGPAPARGQMPDEELYFRAGFGFWFLSLDGDVGVGNLESEVDVGFDDLLDKTTLSLNPSLEVVKGDWVLRFDGAFNQLEDSRTFAGGRRGSDTDMTMGIFDLSLGYTLVRAELGNGMPLTVTPAVGARVTYLDVELDPRDSGSESCGKTWVDPYVGGRVVLGLNGDVDWRTQGSIGGFGVGSDLTWTAGSYLDWEFAKDWTLEVGYRAVRWDYDQDDLRWDMTFHGPWLGISYAWR